MNGDAGILYNAGTAALERGQIGEAVAFLLAARRIDPRAADARRNLAIAERAGTVARGETAPPVPRGPAFALSAAEGWWLAALLIAAGTAAAVLLLVRSGADRAGPYPRWMPGRNPLRLGAIGALSMGMILAAALTAGAVTEHRHPEAVVVAASVEARRDVDETPRAPILLRAGERVRLGRARGEAVEVLLGGSAIGWVPRSALWNVADAPRYTPGFHSK